MTAEPKQRLKLSTRSGWRAGRGENHKMERGTGYQKGGYSRRSGTSFWSGHQKEGDNGKKGFAGELV